MTDDPMGLLQRAKGVAVDFSKFSFTPSDEMRQDAQRLSILFKGEDHEGHLFPPLEDPEGDSRRISKALSLQRRYDRFYKKRRQGRAGNRRKVTVYCWLVGPPCVRITAPELKRILEEG